MYSYSSTLLERRDILCHISHQFDEDLLCLHHDILSMGCLVAEQVELGMSALFEADAEMGKGVIAAAHQINAMQISANDACVRILTKRQPTARDLRLVRAMNKAIFDFELMGNEAQRIALCAAEFAAPTSKKSQFTGLACFASCVNEMLHDALSAFACMDFSQALEILRGSKGTINGQYESIVRQQITYMMEDPCLAPVCMKVLCLAYSLACIGKSSNNICRYVVYYEGAHNSARHRSLYDNASTIVAPGDF